MDNLAQLGGTAGVAIALTQLLKQYVPDQFKSLVAVAISVVAYLVINGFSLQSGVDGLVAGLVAVGLYQQKNVVSS